MKRIFIAIILAASLVISLLLWKHSANSGPSYQDRTAREWLLDVNGSNPVAAMEAFRGMGTNAFPFLIGSLEKREPFQRRLNRAIYPYLPGRLQRFWSSPGSSSREPDQTWAAAYWVLANVSNANETLPELTRIWQHKEYESRRYVLTLVSLLAGPKDTECVPVLIDGIKDAGFAPRMFAFEGLMRMGPTAKAAVPALTAALKDPDINMRVLAGVCLWKIDGQTNMAVPLLHQVVNTESSVYTRRQSANWLLEIDPHDEMVVPAFTRRLESSSLEIRKEAVGVLGSFGVSAKSAVPALVKLIDSPDRDLRDPALSSLKKIDPETAAKYGVK